MTRTDDYITGSKLAHFKEIHKKTGIPYEEMVRSHDPLSQVPSLMLFVSQVFYDGKVAVHLG